jgi:hypothetical protein
MRISNKNIPGIPRYDADEVGANRPWLWYGVTAVDGTVAPWKDAPLGSLYLLTVAGSVTQYTKAANVPATADWVSQVLTSGTQTIAGVKTFSSPLKTSYGLGAVVAGKCTAVEYGDGLVHQTVLTLTLTGANDLDLADGADHGTSIKIYDMPEGRILLLGATCDLSAVVNDAFNASPNDVFIVAVGSVAANDAAGLTGTEVNIIPASTLDTVGNTTLTLPWKSALAASAQFDGTTTAMDVIVNATVADASTTKAMTLAITGTLTLTWVNLGDY